MLRLSIHMRCFLIWRMVLNHRFKNIYTRYFFTYTIAYATVLSYTVTSDAQGGSSVDPMVVEAEINPVNASYALELLCRVLHENY